MQQCVFSCGGVVDTPQNVDVPRVHARPSFFRKKAHFKSCGGAFSSFCSNCVRNVTTLCHCSSNHITLIIA